jgi:hypothetical protein
MTICYKCEDLVASPEGHHNFPMCESCFNGWATFTCEMCQNGLASQEMNFKDGQLEWWCTSCEEDFKAEYV